MRKKHVSLDAQGDRWNIYKKGMFYEVFKQTGDKTISYFKARRMKDILELLANVGIRARMVDSAG